MFTEPGHDGVEAQKNAVRRETARLVLDGVVLKLPCAQCGNVRVLAYHPDLRFPRVVVWLCRKHLREMEFEVQPVPPRPSQRPPTKRDLELAELQALIYKHEDRP